MANTIVLITSSLTMVLAVVSSRVNDRRATGSFLITTIVLGVLFLGVKMYEYHDKHVEHIVPGVDFRLSGPEAGHMQILFCFYFIMTGLHAVRMVIGVGLLVWLYRRNSQGA